MAIGGSGPPPGALPGLRRWVAEIGVAPSGGVGCGGYTPVARQLGPYHPVHCRRSFSLHG
eukprot:1056644-Alexandrium_andersonii.AAC.1